MSAPAWLWRSLMALGAAVIAVAAGRGYSERPPAPLVSRWTRSHPDVVSLAVAPDGRRLFALSRHGVLTCLDEDGEARWQQAVPEARRVLAGPNGQLVAAYHPGSPLANTVWLFDRLGHPLAEVTAPDAITCLAVAGAEPAMAIGIQNGVLICRRQGGEFRTHRLPVNGEVAQVCFAPNRTLYVLTREPDALRRVRLEGGGPLWQVAFPPGSEPRLAARPDGELVAVAHQAEKGWLLLQAYQPGGRVVWQTRIPGRDPTVRLAAGGGALLLSYEHRLAHEDRTYYERRLSYLSLEPDGGSWVKGGPYTTALPAALGADGGWIVTLDVRWSLRPPQFRLLGPRGERRWLHPCAAPVLIAAASPDGRVIAAYRSDRVIELLEVTRPSPSG